MELRDTTDPRNIDPEAYLRLVLLARGVAVARPQHLVKYSAPTPARPENGMEGFAILVFFNNISSFSPVFPFYMSHVWDILSSSFSQFLWRRVPYATSLWLPFLFSPLSLQIIVSCTLQSLCTYKPNSYFTGNWSSLWRAPLQEEERKGEPHICSLLVSVLWRLASCRIGTLSAGVLSYGLRHPEHTLHALADTVHAFQLHSDADMVWIYH